MTNDPFEFDNAPQNKQQKNWTIDVAIYAGRAYITHFFEQAAPDAVNNLKSRISNLQHILGCSKSKVMQYILYSGLAALEDKIAAAQSGNAPQPGDPHYAAWEIAQETRAIHEQNAICRELEPIYRKYGPDGFVAWCRQRGIDATAFLEQYTWLAPNAKQADRDKDWLRGYLLSKGGNAAVAEIKAQAALDGMLVAADDWQRIEKCAERISVTKSYGTWRLP